MREKSMCAVAIVLMVALMITLTNAIINDRYTTDAMVVKVDGQTISAEDSAGNVWCYTVDGDTVPRVGGRVVLTLLAMGSDTIYDDKVVDVECA